jgi:hypothetical protein
MSFTMLNPRPRLMATVPFCLLLLGWSEKVHAQQVAPPTTSTAAADDAPTVADSDAAQRAKLLNSDCWRRAMFELNEWFRTQTIYTPEEAARVRSDFADRVELMSPGELKEVIADMDAKFRILDKPEVREVRAWFAQYMAVLAERRRAELLAEIPDFPTMTASELNQAVMKIQRKKSSQARFNQSRQAKVNAQLQANQANLAAHTAARNRLAQRSAYRSPYRPPPREPPFDDVQIGPRRSMSIGPNGGVWMNLSF